MGSSLHRGEKPFPSDNQARRKLPSEVNLRGRRWRRKRRSRHPWRKLPLGRCLPLRDKVHKCSVRDAVYGEDLGEGSSLIESRREPTQRLLNAWTTQSLVISRHAQHSFHSRVMMFTKTSWLPQFEDSMSDGVNRVLVINWLRPSQLLLRFFDV